MNKNKLGLFILFSIMLVEIAILCKYFLSPDIDFAGFTPAIAIGLFAGMIIPKRGASFLLPLLSVFIADCVIQLFYVNDMFPYPGFYTTQWKNYLILILSTTMIGWAVKGRTYSSIFVGAIGAPTCYFLLSNFNVWISTSEVAYPKTFAGLINCYELALPFYRNGLIATVIFLPLILLTYNYFVNQKTALVVSK